MWHGCCRKTFSLLWHCGISRAWQSAFISSPLPPGFTCISKDEGVTAGSCLCDKVVCFMQATIHVDIPGLHDKEDLHQIPNNVEVTWECPPNPSLLDTVYNEEIWNFEFQVVRVKQIHTCSCWHCLIVNAQGHYRCKCQAPFPLSDIDVVRADGSWQVKQLYEYVNGWMPALSINLWCNNDCKILINGGDTKNLSFYAVALYQTKKQGKNFNMSAVMAKAFGSHLKHISNENYVCTKSSWPTAAAPLPGDPCC